VQYVLHEINISAFWYGLEKIAEDSVAAFLYLVQPLFLLPSRTGTHFPARGTYKCWQSLSLIESKFLNERGNSCVLSEARAAHPLL
jgi:hypothetical protein